MCHVCKTRNHFEIVFEISFFTLRAGFFHGYCARLAALSTTLEVPKNNYQT